MSHRTSAAAVAAFCLFSLGAVPLRAQELALLFVHASSPNAELRAPSGFALTGAVDVRSWLLEASFVRYSDETLKPGVVCRVYSPRIDCDPEEVQTSTSLGGLRLEALRALRLGDPVRLALGAGLSFNSVTATADGVSGRRADLHLPNGGQIGWLGLVSLDVAPLAGLPLRLGGSYGAHWLRFTGCVDPEDPTVSSNVPFCGHERFDEVAVGLTWTLPRR
jgi:hypothetical protein